MILYLLACTQVERGVVAVVSKDYDEAEAAEFSAQFTDLDKGREQLAIGMVPVASGVDQLTDMVFAPGDALLYTLQKEGRAAWHDLATGESGTWFTVDVLSVSEQGLLGIALHPQFQDNGRFYLNYSTDLPGREISRVAEWRVDPKDPRSTPSEHHVILDVGQPYQNHNAGDLLFGPDGMLYVGWGDGGLANDPDGHGQNTKTWLGSILRVDVNTPDGTAYAVPKDNPWVGQSSHQPEMFATGFRNPWRMSFAPDGRLVVGDVGQNQWEEITIAGPGENHGWDTREGMHCFDSKECSTQGLTEPIYEYGRTDGASITGGEVWSADGALKDRYIFGDFVTGRIWAIPLPESGPVKAATSLGKWPMLISTFGKDAAGQVYVGDFGAGIVYRITG